MDVRCEKCLTVYEFDDAQVTSQGVTVKCTQCGNLFKVKKRETGEYAAAKATPPRPVYVPPQPQLQVRVALTGEIFKSYDFETIAAWVRQRKITADDQLSRDGSMWQPLGGVPELQAVFGELEPTNNDAMPLALSTTLPMDRPGGEGPTQMGEEAGEEAFARTEPTPRVTGPTPIVAPLDDDLDWHPPRRSSGWTVFFLLLLVVGGGAGYLVMFRKDLVKQITGGGRARRTYEAGREKQALDTDDGFRQAVALFAEAHGADADDALPLAALAEADAQWAWYLREDAHALESSGGQGAQAAQSAATALRKEAQGHLDDAKRAASDALAIDPEAVEVNRAMADFLRVDGAPAVEVERYLKRATERAPADADASFVAGALAFREGQLDQARTQLDQALKAAQAVGKPLYRASYLQAKLALQAGRKDEARALLQGLAQHDRAKTLLAQVEVAAPVVTVVDAGALAKQQPDMATVAPAPPAPTPTVTPIAVAAKPGDYNKIVQQADKLSENGKTDKARKLYEEALTANPRGVEAITGLGYCDLDKEKFLGAIDRFRQALAISPDYGDALMGIAEAYKVQGNRPQAIEFYKRYLKAQPHGTKATMAQKNLRDLEPKEHGLEPAKAEKAEKTEKPEGETQLPRLPPTPSDDTPPPPP